MSLLTIERSGSCDSLTKIGGETDEDELDGGINDEVFSARSRTSSFEGFFASKGAAYAIPDGDFARKATLKGGELQSHLQGMVNLIRDEDAMRLIVKVESQANYTRYLSIVTTYGVSDEEESILLGFDWVNDNVTMGLVIPLWCNVSIELDGDGGFKIITDHKVYIFKPVSVQTMWTALQWIHRCLASARRGKQFSGGLSHAWLGYYENRILSPRECISYWEYTDDLIMKREEGSFEKVKTDEELLKGLIRHKLKEILRRFDLDEVTCREVRDVLESEMKMSLRHLKGYVDEQMLVVVGQMDSASKITDTIFLGSEWNASNFEELKENNVGYILNVTKEIDNFFPGTFEYMNIRLHDVEEADLLRHWDKTYRFLHKAKEKGSVAFVHCRRGISRSAATVVAFLMKEYKMSLHDAMKLVKTKRSIVQPNPGFWKQLIVYEGILKSSENRHSSLFRRRSNSESNLRRSHKKMRRKKSVETPTDADHTDGAKRHAQTLPRMGHVANPEIHIEPPGMVHIEPPASPEEIDINKGHISENTLPPTSDSPGMSDSGNEGSTTSSDEEASDGQQTMRRSQSEPVMKTIEQLSPVLRKPHARTFVEMDTGSDEEVMVTSPTKIFAILEDTGQNVEDGKNLETADEKQVSSSKSQLENAVVSQELVTSMDEEDKDTDSMAVDVCVEETAEIPTEESAAADVLILPAEPEPFTNVDEQQPIAVTNVVEMEDDQEKQQISEDNSVSSVNLEDKLEEEMVAKKGKWEPLESFKKVEFRSRVRRRDQRSKSDLQLAESGFVKRHTQIIEEQMLYSLLQNSEKTPATLVTSNVADELFLGAVLSHSEKNGFQKDYGENSVDISEKTSEDISNKMPQNTSEKVSDSVSEKVSDNVTEKVSEEISQKMFDEISEKTEVISQKKSNDDDLVTQNASVQCENQKNVLIGNQDLNHIVQVVNAEARKEISSQLEATRSPVARRDDVTDDVMLDEDVCIDPMTWIDLTSHQGNIVKRKSAAFENLAEERAKTENKDKQLAETRPSGLISRPSKELGTSDMSDAPILETLIPDGQREQEAGTVSSISVPKLDLGKLSNDNTPDTSCTIIVEDYRKWETSSVRERTRILENIIAKTGGSFPSPRSRKMKKKVKNGLDEEVTQLFSNVNVVSQDGCTLGTEGDKTEPTSCPIEEELSESLSEDSVDDKVKVLVGKFEGKDIKE